MVGIKRSTGNSVLIYPAPDLLQDATGYREGGNLRMHSEVHLPQAWSCKLLELKAAGCSIKRALRIELSDIKLECPTCGVFHDSKHCLIRMMVDHRGH
jgi:hypothetical protein